MSVWGVVRWPLAAFGELVKEFLDVWEPDARDLERRLHQRYPDMDALNEVEAGIEVHEPNSPYLNWGLDGATTPGIIYYENGYPVDTCNQHTGNASNRCLLLRGHHGPHDDNPPQEWPPLRQQCMRCGDLYNVDHTCLRDLPPVPPGGNPEEVEQPPIAPSSGIGIKEVQEAVIELLAKERRFRDEANDAVPFRWHGGRASAFATVLDLLDGSNAPGALYDRVGEGQ